MPKAWGRNRARIAAAVLAGALLLTGCGAASAPAPSPEREKPLVLTTFTVIADMVRVVAGDAVDVESITKVGAEVHGYEPTPSDLRNAASADLIIDNGLGLERWFQRFLVRVDAPRVQVTDGIEPIAIASGGHEGEPNPHAWMSPVAAQTYVTNIEAALTELVPDRADEFASRADDYRARIAEVADDLTAVISALPDEQRLLVTCEGAFSYLARDLGLEEAYLWPVNSDIQGTPRRVADTIELVTQREVPAVFCETTVDDGAMRQVAAESGADFGGALYVDSLSDADGPVPTYLDLLRYDVDVIVAGLGSRVPDATTPDATTTPDADDDGAGGDRG